MTKISIAMATFNGERFIRPQLDSFVRQTLLPTELIICDDGSTDSTLCIISDFSKSAPFPVVIVKNSTRLGYTANFLQAARMCQGDLIAFSDQDDVWGTHKLECMLQASHASNALLFAHGAEWVNEDGNPVGVVFPTHRRFRKNLPQNRFPGHVIVFRRSLLDMTSHSLTPNKLREIAGDVEIGHDVLLPEIAAAIGRLQFIPSVLMQYRVYWRGPQVEVKLTDSASSPMARFASRVWPPDLVQRYTAAGLLYRKHSILLSCIISDVAAFNGSGVSSLAGLAMLKGLMEGRADVMGLRAKFYASPSRPARIRLMLKGAKIGQYRGAEHGGVGIQNFVRDALACLVPKPLVSTQ